MFTVYIFNEVSQQYIRIMQMESKGFFNLLLPALPYDLVYIQQGRGNRGINKYLASGLRVVETGRNKSIQQDQNIILEPVKAKQPFETGNVIHWGYEQQASNDEGSVDFDDAVRLACENDDMEPPTPMQEKEARKAFRNEFKRR